MDTDVIWKLWLSIGILYYVCTVTYFIHTVPPHLYVLTYPHITGDIYPHVYVQYVDDYILLSKAPK